MRPSRTKCSAILRQIANVHLSATLLYGWIEERRENNEERGLDESRVLGACVHTYLTLLEELIAQSVYTNAKHTDMLANTQIKKKITTTIVCVFCVGGRG